MEIEFLHIGKNAGTQIMHVAGQVMANRPDLVIRKHPHKVHLIDLPKDARYFFSVRDPVSRFRSGFYSRKRKGQPRLNVEWNPDERLTFETFEHANDLAEALWTPGARGEAALCGMLSISHVSAMQRDHFHRCGQFLKLRPPLAILRQDNLEKDLKLLLDRIGYTGPYSLGERGEQKHANNYENTPELSVLARENLIRWYAQDVAFYEICCQWMQRGAPQ